MILAGRGEYSKALEYCDQVIEIDSFSVHAEYIKGLIHRQQNHLSEAAKAYQTILFLQNDFALAHYELANVHLKLNNIKDAAISFNNTLKNLENMPDSIFLKYSGGFSKKDLEQICINRLK